jgi:mRNA-degrading endonuclease RelE of RelBE toxin-antitoxin system
MAWPPFSGGPRSVDTQVLTLRRKLEQAGLGEGGGIETVRQQGYRLIYTVQDEVLIVLVLTISKRENNAVYLALSKKLTP